MKTKIGIILFLFTLMTQISCTNKRQNQKVILETAFGNIIIELFENEAPLSCQNFLDYIDKNLWEGAKFYRVVRMDNQPDNDTKIEVIQGGLMLDDNEYLLPPVEHETTEKTGILHKDGVISLARNEPGTASSEFFICIGNQPALDYGGMRNSDQQGFAAFGKVIEGMEIVKQIQQLPDTNQFLIDYVALKSIKRIN